MAIQPTFTVSTVIKLKRESSVMNTSRTLISVLFLLVLGFVGNAAAVVPNPPSEKKIVIVNNSGERVFFRWPRRGQPSGILIYGCKRFL